MNIRLNELDCTFLTVSSAITYFLVKDSKHNQARQKFPAASHPNRTPLRQKSTFLLVKGVWISTGRLRRVDPSFVTWYGVIWPL